MYSDFGLPIAGQWQPGVTEATAPVFSPVTELPLGGFPVATVADTNAAIGAAVQGLAAVAGAAVAGWRKLTDGVVLSTEKGGC
jgi:succinate-semialdehyde dehydrogenase / glutarate-semialdehyde dehydrogenase